MLFWLRREGQVSECGGLSELCRTPASLDDGKGGSDSWESLVW